MRIRRHIGAAAAALLMICATGWAQTSLPLTDDAYINANKPANNSGTTDNLFVHSWGPKYGLVRFDAASIAGQDISKATLRLYLSSLYRNGTISVRPIASGWNEATVTWNSQPPAEAAATAIVGLTTGDVGGMVSIDVTAAVQRWADGNLADAGFLIVTSDSIKAYFDAKEMADGVPATLTVVTGPAVSEGRIVLDFTVASDCTIDEPGYYILDRSWNFSAPGPQHACPENNFGNVLIETDGVILDLQGYSLTSDDLVAIVYSGNYQTFVRNGTIESRRYTILGDTGGEIFLKNMQTVGNVQSGGGSVLNSKLTNTGSSSPSALRVLGCKTTDSCIFRDSTFTCEGAPSHCVAISLREAQGLVRAEFRNNHITTNRGGLEFHADSGIVAGNVIYRRAMPGSSNSGTGMNIIGNNIVVAWNTITADTNDGEGIRVGPLASFSGSIIEGNIISGAWQGIYFNNSTGNFFGNNRVSATIPFKDTEGQTDWGGNVSF